MLSLNTKSECTRNILVCVNVLSQLDYLYLIFNENPDYKFYVFIQNGFCLQDFYNCRLAGLPNLIISSNPLELFCIIENIGMVLTAGCVVSRHCMKALQLLVTCSELNIPIVEVQHSLFQHGMHYFVENKSYAETKSYETINHNINIDHLTDDLLSFYPVTAEHRQGTVIGFPKYHLNDLLLSYYDAKYVLILTDINFDLFSPEEFDIFLGCLIKTAVTHPNIQFLLKPSENDADCFLNKTINLGSYENITFVQSDPVLSLISLDSLIKNSAKVVVSTASNVLLDCEAYRKDIAVFRSNSNALLLNEINSCCTFGTPDELTVFVESKEHSPIETGKLIEFDNLKFREFIERSFKISKQPKGKILKEIVRFSALFPQNIG